LRSVRIDVLAPARQSTLWLVARAVVRAVVVHTARQILFAVHAPAFAAVLILFVAVSLTGACTRIVNLLAPPTPVISVKVSVSLHDQPPCMMRVQAQRRVAGS